MARFSAWRCTTVVAGSVAILLAGACGGGRDATPDGEDGEEQARSTEPLTLIVPYAAGGGTDVLARQLAPLMDDELGRSIVVINQPEGSTVPALNEVLSDTAGDTVVFEGTIIAGLEPLGIAELGPADFVPIGIAQADSVAIAVAGDSEYQDIDDFVEAVEANPDEVLVATSVAGGVTHAAATLLQQGGLPIGITPITGGAANQITEVLGGRVGAVISTPAEMTQFVESGDMRLLAVGAEEPVEAAPDVPTFAEAGLPTETVKAFRVVLASPEAPEAERARIEGALLTAVESEEFRQFLEENSFESFAQDGAEATEFLQEEAELYQQIYGDAP